MAGASPAHEKLLKALRELSVGPPDIAPPEEALKPIVSGPWEHFQLLVPVLLGMWRCSMVRSLLALLFGLGAFPAAGLAQLLGYPGWLYSALLGLGVLLCVSGVVGVPGGVPFLEVQTKAGFYGGRGGKSEKQTGKIREAFEAWIGGYSPNKLLRSGELCTMLPYVWNKNYGKDLKYERVWIEAEGKDKEKCACDWVFPPGGFDPERPVVLLLTGLAPDTHWTVAGGFVACAAWYLTVRRGMTVSILVARGTMDTEVREHMFHGARMSDFREMVLVAEKALSAIGKAPLFGAGFSMGAMILANYLSRFGSDARLRGGVNFSGMYDAMAGTKFEYSLKTWQTTLAYSLKTATLTPRIIKEAVRRGVDMEKVMKECHSVTDLDATFVAKFNGFGTLENFYRELTIAGDGKWKNVAVPLLAIAARDDPITHCDALHAIEYSEGNKNMLYLITDRGGHVGWPWGWKPWEKGFDFMNEGIALFVESMVDASG